MTEFKAKYFQMIEYLHQIHGLKFWQFIESHDGYTSFHLNDKYKFIVSTTFNQTWFLEKDEGRIWVGHRPATLFQILEDNDVDLKLKTQLLFNLDLFNNERIYTFKLTEMES